MVGTRKLSTRSRRGCALVHATRGLQRGSATKPAHLRCYADAIETALASGRIRPHAYSSLVLAASYAQLGRDQEATSALAEIRMAPADIAKITRWYLDRYSDAGAREVMAEGLRKTGLLQHAD